MKPITKLFKIALLLCVIFFSTSFKNAHPIKLTASLVEYNPKTQSLRMECRVFIDDFSYSLNKTLAKDMNLEAMTTADKKGIEDYFKKYYILTINDNVYPLKFKEYEVLEEYNILSIKFSENHLPIKKGDQIYIKNTLLIEEFGFLQSNRILLRMPPFFEEKNYETTFENEAITIKL